MVALTWRAMGPSVLAGAFIILLGVPLQVWDSEHFHMIRLKSFNSHYFHSSDTIQGWISRMFSRLRKQTATLTDERIRIMHEIINGVKVI